jgi:hypothetical protein
LLFSSKGGSRSTLEDIERSKIKTDHDVGDEHPFTIHLPSISHQFTIHIVVNVGHQATGYQDLRLAQVYQHPFSLGGERKCDVRPEDRTRARARERWPKILSDFFEVF